MNPFLQRCLLIGLAATTCLLAACDDDDDDDDKYAAQIRRTSFGIPHIKASDEAGLGYGVGYAYAEDNFCLLADAFVTANGERSKYFGADATTRDVAALELRNESADYYYRLMNDAQTVATAWSEQPAEIQALLKGYAAGYNRYLKDAARADLRPECKDEPWVRPINEQDLIKLMRLYALHDTLGLVEGVVGAAPPSIAQSSRHIYVSADRWSSDRLRTGSNAVALGKDATENGRGMLLGNPHFPWQGLLRMYQMHLTIPGKLDVMGASLPGLPVVGIGFTQNFAWSHTTTTSTHYTLFEIAVDPADATRYVLDGQVKNMTRKTVSIEVRGSDGVVRPRSRDFYSSEFGPMIVIRDPNAGIDLNWTSSVAYSLRNANANNHRLYRQWYEMNRATTLEELKSANERIVGNPWNNTIAVDKNGTTLFQAVSPVPNVPAEKLSACIGEQHAPLTTYGLFVLTGNAACNWIVDPTAPEAGIVAGAKMPALTRTDYVQNSNDSAWLSNAAAPITGFSPLVSSGDYEQSGRTRFGISQIESRLAGTDGLGGNRFTLKQLQDMVMNNRVYYADLLQEDLLTLCAGATTAVAEDGANVDLTDACARLTSWDRTANADAGIEFGYFMGFMDRVRAIPSVWRVPFDLTDPVRTPHGLNLSDSEVVEALRSALASSVRATQMSGWQPEVRWGDLQAVTHDGTNIPIHGGSDAYGIYNVMESAPAEDGHLRVYWGTSYLQAVAFDEKGPRAEAFLTYSQSTDPRSPHYADQAVRFSNKEWIRQPFSEADIAADPQLRTQWIAE